MGTHRLLLALSLLVSQAAAATGIPWYDGGWLVQGDTGERTHGTVNYRSIRGGHSHGCHRLYNHLALRLGQFVLHHRPHVVLGEIADRYERRIVVAGRARRLHRESRGHAYRLDEPVPVTVRRP